MRVLNYPFEANTAFLKDRYGNNRGSFQLKKGENTLPFTQKGFYVQDSFNNVFYVYEGEGVLEFSDASVYYDFSRLDFKELDRFLGGLLCGESVENKSCEAYLKFLEKNFTQNYIVPFGNMR